LTDVQLHRPRSGAPTVALLTGNHLCNNPRVIKEAITLQNAGYHAVILGGWFDHKLKARDQAIMEGAPFSYVPVIDIAEGAWSRARARGWRKMTRIACKAVSAESPTQLGAAYGALRRAALKQQADLCIAHSEVGLAVATELLGHDRAVGVDFEDWFSQDLLPEARKHRPLRLLSSFESALAKRGCHLTCPAAAMSAALATAYQSARPTVIYNAFPWSDRATIDETKTDRASRAVRSIYWFSQTIGPGRGLEDLFAALPLLRTEVELHLRGARATGFEAWFRRHTSETIRRRIVLHDVVPAGQLLSRLAEHDIGFAGEVASIRSRDLTVTNKILHYLLGGVPVVASDTAGQREVADQAPDAVHLYPSGNPAALAERIDALLCDPEQLDRGRTAAIAAAQRVFCWERQESILIGAVERALERAAATRQRVRVRDPIAETKTLALT
jgi:glycosyltransferase involved in cell wall biosynthesis